MYQVIVDGLLLLALAGLAAALWAGAYGLWTLVVVDQWNNF